MSTDNAYAELGLAPGASEAEVKAAWRRLVSLWHPDRNSSASAVQKMQRLNEALFEVVLTVTLTCKVGDKTAYVAEVEQAGVFGLVGLQPQAIDVLLGTQCPNILFPYVRQIVGELIQAGGFPPFLLQPINFDALYAETLRQRQQQAGADAAASELPVGNA